MSTHLTIAICDHTLPLNKEDFGIKRYKEIGIAVPPHLFRLVQARFDHVDAIAVVTFLEMYFREGASAFGWTVEEFLNTRKTFLESLRGSVPDEWIDGRPGPAPVTGAFPK